MAIKRTTTSKQKPGSGGGEWLILTERIADGDIPIQELVYSLAEAAGFKYAAKPDGTMGWVQSDAIEPTAKDTLKRYKPTAATRKVIDLIAKGRSNNAICRELHGKSVVSIRTIRSRYESGLYVL